MIIPQQLHLWPCSCSLNVLDWHLGQHPIASHFANSPSPLLNIAPHYLCAALRRRLFPLRPALCQRLAYAVMRGWIHLDPHAIFDPHDVYGQSMHIYPRMIAEQLILFIRVDDVQILRGQNGISSFSSAIISSLLFFLTLSIVAPSKSDFTFFVVSPVLPSSNASTIAAISLIA